ncbi:MAG: GumC family protein [Pirellulales bacterium]
MNSNSESLPSLQQIGQMLLRHKRKMVSAFCCCLLVAVAVTAVMQPAYRSEAKLFLRLGRENAVLDPTATMGQGPVLAVPQSREEEINSVVEILQSDILLGQIVDHFGAGPILGAPVDEVLLESAKSKPAIDAATEPVATIAPVPAKASSASADGWLSQLWSRIGPGPQSTPHNRAMTKLRKRLQVFATKKSNVITLRYDGPNPKFAQAVVNKLSDLYLSHHISLNRTPRSHDFFADQTDGLRTRLSKTELALRELRDETGISSASEQRTILVKRLGELEDAKLDADSNLAVAAAELESMQTRLAVLPPMLEVSRVDGLANQAFDLMRQRLYELQLKEQQLKSVFKDEAFQVREIRREIAEAKKILDQEHAESTSVTTAKNKAYEETEMQLMDRKTKVAALQARAETLQVQLVNAKKDLEQLNRDALRITQLERDLELQDTQFRSYSRNLEQARIDQALETNRISNICVVQPATIDIDPVRPSKITNLGLGILMGIFSGLCLALLAEYFDRSMKTAEDIETRLGLPMLGELPWASFRQPISKDKKGAHDRPLPH